MSANAYELLALMMRYVFAALMVLIVLRAWRITFIDNRRAAKLRRLSPDTGIIGEMMVTGGSERARPGMRYPVTLEGSIGSGRRADIRIRHSSIRARHAVFQMTDEGLFVRGHAHNRIRDGHGRLARQLVLHDGEILRIGEVALLLVLTDADSAPEEINRRVLRRRPQMIASAHPGDVDMDADYDDSLFDADDMFESNPAGNFDDQRVDLPEDLFFGDADGEEDEDINPWNSFR